jgi:molybdenum cofactor synthesis domain-containing protein
MGERVVTAALVIIGNEILSGRTVDANLPYLAGALDRAGIRLKEVRVVADETAAIADAVNALRERYDHVLTTGGIGPTHDDITSAAVAHALGLRLTRHPEADRRLRAYYPPDKLNEARLRMADTPEGATLIDNPVSVAPGFSIGNVHVLPGVPKIMQAMFEGLRTRLRGGVPLTTLTIVAFCPEGEIARLLGEVQAAHAAVEIGSYPFMRQGRFGTSLVFRGQDRHAVEGAVAALRAATRDMGVEFAALPGDEGPVPGDHPS